MEEIMKKRIEILSGAVVAVVLVAGLYGLGIRSLAPAHRVRAATMTHPLAPDFTLTDINGAKLSLSDYKGRVVLLDFWASWCGPCRIEIPWFVEMQERYRDQGFAVLGVAMQDTQDSVGNFYQQFHLNYPVAMGNAQLAALYGGIYGLPTSFVIGRDGRIYAQHSGTTGAVIFQKEIEQLLADKSQDEDTDFTPAGEPEEIEVGTPGEANPDVPGVDISKLSPAELAEYKKQLDGAKCTCGGCKFSLLQCRRDDTTCPVSRKAARDMLKQMQDAKDKSKAQVGAGAGR
jgi:thiol-disulfide isomerase/thioredoxin